MNRFSKLTLIGLAAALALAACSKGEQSSTTTTTESSPGAMSASSPAAEASPAANGVAANDGSKVYQTNCSSCHQANGQGVPGTFPPLAKNSTVTGDPAKVVHIVKYGLNGKLVVNGTTYSGMMPAWGPQLSDADIASAVTYIRSSWGNSASAVTAAQVKAVKK